CDLFIGFEQRDPRIVSAHQNQSRSGRFLSERVAHLSLKLDVPSFAGNRQSLRLVFDIEPRGSKRFFAGAPCSIQRTRAFAQKVEICERIVSALDSEMFGKDSCGSADQLRDTRRPISQSKQSLPSQFSVFNCAEAFPKVFDLRLRS